MRYNDLLWLTFDGYKGGAQGFVTLNNCVQTLLECCHIEMTGQSQSHKNIVDSMTWLQLIEKPEALLCKRERQMVCLLSRSQRGRLLCGKTLLGKQQSKE